MRFLVTGGAGFLGSHLANRLASDGHDVTVLDDLSNGSRKHLNPAIMFKQGDVDNIPLLWSLLHDVDCVYHFAAKVSVAESVLHPRSYNRVNVGGTVSLMEAMRDTGVQRVVFTSSGSVYGRFYQKPVTEADIPQPNTPYAVSKWAAEQYIHTIGEIYGLETVALRIFNAYGPHQSLPLSHAPVVPRFLQQAFTGGSVVIFGNGEQIRDFVYIDDVVDGLLTAATAPNINRTVINIGSGTETNLNSLVDQIETAVGRSVNRIYNRAKVGGVPHLVANVTQAKKLLGFQPKISLADGLAITLEKDTRFN